MQLPGTESSLTSEKILRKAMYLQRWRLIFHHGNRLTAKMNQETYEIAHMTLALIWSGQDAVVV